MLRLRFPIAWAGAAALAVTAFAPSARAADQASFAINFFLSATLGPRPVVGFGTDFRMMGLTSGKNHGCNQDRRAGGGPFAQVTWLIPYGARFTVGGHGGGEVTQDSWAVEGDLAWTYRVRSEGVAGAHGILVALTPEVFPVMASGQGIFNFSGEHFEAEGTALVGSGPVQLFEPRGICEFDVPNARTH